MADNWQPMTDEERRALLEKWNQENLASMTPFERYPWIKTRSNGTPKKRWNDPENGSFLDAARAVAE